MEEMQKKIGPLSTLDDHKSTAHFRKAFDKQSNYIETAIKSLNSLDEQIIQFLFTPKASDIDFDHDFSTKDRESLCNSMALMRRLLLDAQGKFRKMVDDNKQLAERIDSSIGLATQEVNVLRGQLAETNRRLNEMQDYGELVDLKMSSTLNSTANTTLPDNDVAAPGAPQRSNQDAEEICQLREENGKLKKTIQTLRQEVEEMRCSIKTSNTSDASKVNELKLDLIQTKQELHRARDALQAMKADRKRLKAEKLDLLGQMKQLYCTLEDKESELRDFIRNYEQRMAESDQNIKQLGSEKEECDREKWEIMNKARETAEKMVSVRAELDAKDLKIQQMEMEISQMRERLSSGAMTCGMRTSMASEVSIPSPGHGQNPMEEDLAFRTPPPDPPNSARSVKSGDSCQSNTSSSAQNSTVQNGSIENLAPIGESSRSSEDLNDGMYVTISPEAKKKKRRSLVAFSKMFNKAKSRRSLASAEGSLILDDGPSSPGSRLSMLCQENYADKLATLQAAKLMPMVNWKASHVLAWLEIDVYMPMYGRVCAENIKSGKILLGLSDSELDSALNIQRPLHRRKLRLAIEEYRDPNATKYPKAGSLDHTYVSHRWLADLGLPQYMSVFEGHLVDGRILNNLNKKDLEKHLQVTRRFHQASILHGIELLRRIDFDKETLNLRRSSCEDNDSDLLVWTNQRLVEWVRSIDLEEYADCLLESGVHGAVLVLEPTFNVESLASLLSIPPTKSYVRRHLASELDLIVKPARVERPVRQALESSSKRKSSLGFVRTYRGGSTSGDEDSGRGSSGKGRLSFRGSLGRALGKKLKHNLAQQGRSLDETHRNTTKSSSDNNLHLKVNQDQQLRSPSPIIPVYQRSPGTFHHLQQNRCASPAVLQSTSSPAISHCSMLSPEAHSSPLPGVSSHSNMISPESPQPGVSSRFESQSSTNLTTVINGDTDRRVPGPAVPPRNSSLRSSQGHLLSSPILQHQSSGNLESCSGCSNSGTVEGHYDRPKPARLVTSSVKNLAKNHRDRSRERKDRKDLPVWLPPPPPPPPPQPTQPPPPPPPNRRRSGPVTSKSQPHLASIATTQQPIPAPRKASTPVANRSKQQRRSLAVPGNCQSPVSAQTQKLTAAKRSASADLMHLESTQV